MIRLNKDYNNAASRPCIEAVTVRDGRKIRAVQNFIALRLHREASRLVGRGHILCSSSRSERIGFRLPVYWRVFAIAKSARPRTTQSGRIALRRSEEHTS